MLRVDSTSPIISLLCSILLAQIIPVDPISKAVFFFLSKTCSNKFIKCFLLSACLLLDEPINKEVYKMPKNLKIKKKPYFPVFINVNRELCNTEMLCLKIDFCFCQESGISEFLVTVFVKRAICRGCRSTTIRKMLCSLTRGESRRVSTLPRARCQDQMINCGRGELGCLFHDDVERECSLFGYDPLLSCIQYSVEGCCTCCIFG